MPSSVIGDLADKADSNLVSIIALRSELRDLRDLSNSKNPPITGEPIIASSDSGIKDLMERLEIVEEALTKLSPSMPLSTEQRIATFDMQMKARAIPTEVSVIEQYQNSESYFESDAGKPLGDYENAIDDSLHSVEGIDVKGVDCRDTICKITYSKSESVTSQEQGDVDSNLADKLMFGVEGRVVELRYANDTMGNNVIYAELK